MSAGGDADITFRKLELDFPPGLDPLIIEGQPEESYINIGLSLLLPHLEPYLIRSMNRAKPHVVDPRVLAGLALFNAQEGQHYRQHARFNAAVHLAGGEKLKVLEAELADDYRRFEKTRSLRFNLAYAEGFEALTMALARFAFETKLTERMRPEVRDLFEWHLLEELEHRTVAFDVYAQVCGGYFYRLFVGLFAQWHLNRFVLRAALAIKAADGPAFPERWGGLRATWRRLKPHAWRALRLLVPKVWATYLPWYTPHRIAMPAQALARARHYTEAAREQAAARGRAPLSARSTAAAGEHRQPEREQTDG